MPTLNPRTGRPMKRAFPVQPLHAPPGWTGDELTKFLDNARNSQWATFAKKRPMVGKLIQIDAQLVKVSKDWLNPERDIPAQLLLRSHSAFRTAAGLAMAGQACEAAVISRSMLEFAAYAAHIYRDVSLETVWLNRHDDAVAMKQQKKAFQQMTVLASVKAANREAGKRFEDLYQLTIDFGGHPNERSVTANMTMTEEPGKLTVKAIMQHGDGIVLDHALKTVARCGVVSLEMLQIPFNARFELLGINAAILQLRKGLWAPLISPSIRSSTAWPCRAQIERIGLHAIALRGHGRFRRSLARSLS